ncbi:hypothetical protein IF188_09035 [Microbacterium sp. NEAU-LLC]|uniref:Uncharacterized protein n=1 Tax=Microbacterium helvum TaxID=2773713 RepID=A0ABR8NME7_9MICO|nr:hypothetical protein [Microbacterium helvum]MBD3941836.1 hypothetical protein [Microbacterium helvum]
MTLPSETPAAGDASSSAAASSGAAGAEPTAPGPAVPDVPATPGADAGAAVRDARLAWLIGGSLSIAYAVLVLVSTGNPLLSFTGGGIVRYALWAAALLVFAFGVRRRGSVVARRPLGIVALVIAAAVPLLSYLWGAFAPLGAMDTLTIDTVGMDAAAADAAATAAMVGNATTVVALGALIVGTVVIARAGAVPRRIRWVPLIVLAVVAGAQIALMIVAVSLTDDLIRPDMTAAYFAVTLLGPLGVLLLGILAIVSAPREAPRPAPPTQVYPPAS